MGATHVVRNAAELDAVWGQVQAGDTISLAAGDYGNALIRRVAFDTPVTLQSADPENPAIFETLSISESKGLVVENVGVVLQVDETTSAGVRGVYITGSEDIEIRDSMIVGGNAVVGVSTDTDPETIPDGVPYIGEPIGAAVYITGSEDIKISDNEVTGYQRGITVLSSDEVLVSDNYIHDLRGTPFRSNGSHNVTVEGNEFTHFSPINFGGHGDHGDFIHFWDTAADAPITNLVVRDNFFHQGEGTALMGIVFSTPAESMGFDNVVVENNVIYNGDRAGVVLENVHNANVTNNTLVQANGDDTRSAPGIRIDFASSDITVADNLASEVAIIGDRVDVNSLTIRNNIDVQSHSPMDNNYIGDILVNGMVDPGKAQLSDFSLVPGLSGTGVGANVQNDDTVFFGAETTASDRTSLSAIFSVEGAQEDGATYTFHFADGTSKEGTEVRHEFSEAGRHEVTLVAVVNGQTQSIVRTIEVFDPVRFDLGSLDASAQDVSLIGDIDLNGDRAVFGGSAAQIKVDLMATELEDLTEFSVAFRFAFNEESSARETLVRVTSYFTIMVDGEKLTALIWLDDGNVVKLETLVQDLQSGNAFDLSFVFDELNGVANLYIDGEVVASREGIEEPMGDGGFAPLYVGGVGSHGDFKGWIENLVIQTDSSLTRPETADDKTDSNPGDEPSDNTSDPDSEVSEEEEAQVGGTGNDLLIGGEKEDTLNGGKGEDTLEGGDGNDLLNAGSGHDALNGGKGNDWLNAGRGTDKLEGGDGNDQLNAGSGHDALNGGKGNDWLNAGRGTDKLEGGGGDDVLRGGAQTDSLNGGNGNDQVFGNSGGDNLSGGLGRDKINGGGGDDTLTGGMGADTLKGDAGEDTFIFSDFHGHDAIKDFDTRESDVLDLRNLSSLRNFDDLLAASQEVGQNLHIQTGETSSITLKDTSFNDLMEDDVLF